MKFKPRGAIPLALIAVMFLAGGSARPEAWAQIVARLAAIAVIAASLLSRGAQGRLESPVTMRFLAAISVLILIQLLPLPPGVWPALGGRELVLASQRAAGFAPGWQPISLTPDMTANAALALLPAWAAAISLARAPGRSSHLLMAIAVGIGVSAVLGLLQIVTKSPVLYFYRITNFGVGTGGMANRNHQALLIAMIFPLLGALPYLRPDAGSGRSLVTLITIGVTALVALAALFATGSRAGLLLAALGIAAGIGIAWRHDRSSLIGKPSRVNWPAAGLIGSVILAVTAVVLLRSETFGRLLALRVGEDGRVVLLGPMLRIAREYFPFGSGFGSFPTVFRIYEPDQGLGLAWLNHAHNDLIEIAIEGGAAALLVLFAFFLWFGREIVQLCRAEVQIADAKAWCGAAWAMLVLVASLFDYPLRTPLIMVLFVVALALVETRRARRRG